MDIILKGIPDELSEKEIKEWVSIYIERHFKVKTEEIPEVLVAVEQSKADIDKFRTDNNLAEKYSKESIIKGDVI